MQSVSKVKTMKLRHATTKSRAKRIEREGFKVAKADPNAKIKGCWFCSPSNSAWGVLHTIRKHGARLEDVVVIEVEIPRSQLRRFRRGLWYTGVDVPVGAIREIYQGEAFGAGAQ
jgi:hypothetical protein